MKSSNVFLAIGVILAGIVFQTAGIVSGWINMLTIAGALVILLVLQKLPQVKFNLACWIFVVWFIFASGIGMVWNQISERAPLTSEAISMRLEQNEIVQSERTRPKALNELETMKTFTDEAANKRAREIIDWMSLAHDDFINGRISKETYDARLAAFSVQAKENKTWREKRSTEILALDSNPHDKTLQETAEGIGNTPGRVVMWTLLGILVIAFIASAITGKVAIKKTAIWAVVLIGAVFLMDHFIWGDELNGIGNKLSSNTGIRNSNSTPFVRDVVPNDWTQVDLPPRPFQWESTVDIRFKFADGRVVDAPKDQWTRLGKIPGPNGKPKRLWVQAMSTPGQVVFTIN